MLPHFELLLVASSTFLARKLNIERKMIDQPRLRTSQLDKLELKLISLDRNILGHKQ